MTTASAYAADIEYNSENVSVKYTSAEGKKNVIIYNSDDTDITSDDIIYINQLDDTSTFSETTKFLTKQNPKEGKYTITMSDDNGTSVSSEFYVGMNAAANDIKMMRRIRPEDQFENKVRYACSVSGTRNINTVIVKMNGEYYGFSLNNPWSVQGASMVFGVEIEAGEGDSIDKITDVWLSERTLTVADTTGNGTLTNGTQTSSESTEEGA